MKRILMLLSFILLLTSSNLFQEEEVYIRIDIEKPVEFDPRSITIYPMDCIYSIPDKAIYIAFFENIGEVAVEVTNTTTGESYYEYVVSADGQVVVTIAGTEGEYLLQMTTENGDLYEGVFRIE